MVHELAIWAVKRKAQTNPPDVLIGNVELAACIGIIYRDAGISEMPEFESAEELYEDFIDKMKNIGTEGLSDRSKKMMDMVKKYQVLCMGNETVEDLKVIIKLALADSQI